MSIIITKQFIKYNFVGALSVACLFLCSTLLAYSATLARGYNTEDTSLTVGMAVARDTNQQDNDHVTGAKSTDLNNFVGIVTTFDANLISVSGAKGDILVTSEGVVEAYASNINGNIESGDLLTLSPVVGTLMKLDDSAQKAVAVALEDFNSSSEGASNQQLSSINGETISVSIGKIQVDLTSSIVSQNIAVSDNSILASLGSSITGKPVGKYRVFAALAIFAILIIIEGTMIYGSIRNTFVALGRNPLAKKAILGQLLQTSWISLIILIFGLGVVYLILWV